MGPVLVVEVLELPEGVQEVVLVPGERAVQELASASPDPAFGDGVHARRPHVAQHGPDPRIGEDRVERSRKVRATVADHELDTPCLVVEVHDQVAGLLGGPVPGRMQRDAEDADAPGHILDHGQDVGLGAAGQIDTEEAAGQDLLGRGAQELRPGWSGPPRRGADAGDLEDLPYGRRRVDSQAGQLAVDPAVSPAGFSRASRRTRALMSRRMAGRPVLPRLDLAAQRRRAMSRCQRRIVSGVTSSRSPWRRAFGITLSRTAISARSAQVRSAGAAAAVAGRRAGGAGSRSLRSATPPHAGTAAATWSSA